MFREGKKCVIYVRVSTENQVDGFSLDAQRNTLMKFAEREGMIVKDVYEDAGKSGKSIEGRPAFKQLLSDISNGLAIDYILVYKLSRFGRNAADILNSLEYIQSYDINLIATEEGIDSSQTSGKLLISVLSAVSEIERENILEQTMNGRKEKARQGGWNGGFAPFGYTLDSGNIITVDGEAQVVKRIFDDFVEKNIPMGKIAKQLNIEGVSRDLEDVKNKIWSKSAIKNILSNPIYTGVIAFGRRKREKIKGTRNQYHRVETDDYIIGEGKHEAIISKEIFDKANAKMKKYAKGNNAQPFERKYLLSGFVKCPKCGGPMFANNNSYTLLDGTKITNSFYKCSNAHSEIIRCDSKERLDRNAADKIVISKLREYISNGVIANEINNRNSQVVDTSKHDKKLEVLEKRYTQVIEKKKNIEHQIDNMPLDTPYYDRKMNDLNKRLNEMYDVIAEVEEQIADTKLVIKGLTNKNSNTEKILEFLSMFDDLIEEMTSDEIRKCLSFIIHSITFDEDGYLSKINCRLKTPKDISELETMLLGKTEDSGIEYTIDIPREESTKLSVYDKHTPRRCLRDYSGRKAANVGRPKRMIKKIINGEERDVYEFENGYYIAHKRPEHYNRKLATYKQIKDYIKEKYNLTIHSTYIAEIKRKFGIDMQTTRLIEDAKHVNCPKEKEDAIIDALKHFNMITESQA